MKIAICLSGHLRRFELTAANLLKYVKSNYECDIFLHTWDRMGYTSVYKTDITQDLTHKYLSRIEHLYKPKKIIVENSLFIEELKLQGDQYAPHLKGGPKPVGHMASMFYKIYAANELRKQYELESGSKYDWVIRCRPDLLFHGLTNIPLEKTNNIVYVPKHLSGNNWICDQFAIALPEEMDLYSSFFFDIPTYFSSQKEYRPEIFMDYCMKLKGLAPILWDCHFSILR